ncbi:hypothetical protein GCM10007392_44430 [Saccharospirillum salsuginis]|uniref:Uncharacterized protein n=1 Tax=Saccharospirillum salsuginis TaxID=418750 RepID=A0A918NJD6_9GAMM|nr:hypothetical protein GCM10007392_44430 [Saccharospirillum salsuginis]
MPEVVGIECVEVVIVLNGVGTVGEVGVVQQKAHSIRRPTSGAGMKFRVERTASVHHRCHETDLLSTPPAQGPIPIIQLVIVPAGFGVTYQGEVFHDALLCNKVQDLKGAIPI